MGFRSTMITEHVVLEVPGWLYDKYKEVFYFRKTEDGYSFPISSKFEMKTYFETYQNFIKDVQSLIPDNDYDLQVVFLHECGGITKVDIHKDHVYWGEPSGWTNLEKDTYDGVTHNYCYGCSDLKEKFEDIIPSKLDVKQNK